MPISYSIYAYIPEFLKSFINKSLLSTLNLFPFSSPKYTLKEYGLVINSAFTYLTSPFSDITSTTIESLMSRFIFVDNK
jgi:hypothetical protein